MSPAGMRDEPDECCATAAMRGKAKPAAGGDEGLGVALLASLAHALLEASLVDLDSVGDVPVLPFGPAEDERRVHFEATPLAEEEGKVGGGLVRRGCKEHARRGEVEIVHEADVALLGARRWPRLAQPALHRDLR
eukprot:6028061-Pleurochrysis_carterae.AAC.11